MRNSVGLLGDMYLIVINCDTHKFPIALVFWSQPWNLQFVMIVSCEKMTRGPLEHHGSASPCIGLMLRTGPTCGLD